MARNAATALRIVLDLPPQPSVDLANACSAAARSLSAAGAAPRLLPAHRNVSARATARPRLGKSDAGDLFGAVMTRGRKPIDSDIDALVLMAMLRRDADRHGRRFSIRQAADQARDQLVIFGTMPESVSDRLRTKFAHRCRDENSLVARIISQHGPVNLRHLPRRQQELSMLALINTEETSAPPHLADVPAYAAARAKLKTIREDLDERTARRNELRKILAGLSIEKIDQIERGTEEYLQTGKLLERASHEEQLDRIEHEIEIIGRAYVEQAQIVAAEKDKAHEAAAAAVRVSHKALVSEVLTAATALADAIQREADFREDLERRGYHFISMRAVSDTIGSSFGGRRGWNTPFQVFAVRAARYLGLPEWKRG